MTAVSASPASMTAMSPMLRPNEPSSPMFQFLDSSSDHKRRERTASIRSANNSNSPTTSLSQSTINGKDTANKADAFRKSSSRALSPIGETFLPITSGHGFPHLDRSTITRVASMSLEEALEVETHLQHSRISQKSRGQLPATSSHALTSRDRAFSAPVNLDVLDKKLDAVGRESVFAVDIDNSKAHAKAAKTPKKPTPKDAWVADLDCVSDIFGAMLADGDRGRW